MLRKAFVVLAALALLACAAPGGGTDPAPRPQPTRVAPDPNPVGSAGRDAKSVLMYAAWEHEYTKIIDYQNGTLDADGDLLHSFEQRAQTPQGGEVFIASPYKQGTTYEIEVTPKRDREGRGITFCWILWKNVKVTSYYRDDGQVGCTWWAR